MLTKPHHHLYYLRLLSNHYFHLHLNQKLHYHQYSNYFHCHQHLNYLGSVVEVKDVSNLVKLDVDGSNDLKVTLNSINDGVASLTFNKFVTGPTGFVPIEEKSLIGSDLTTNLLIVGDALLVIVLIVILIVVFSRKRKK